jgi:hypothetical protein
VLNVDAEAKVIPNKSWEVLDLRETSRLPGFSRVEVVKSAVSTLSPPSS